VTGVECAQRVLNRCTAEKLAPMLPLTVAFGRQLRERDTRWATHYLVRLLLEAPARRPEAARAREEEGSVV
jgi:hypothetical protein